MLLGHIEEHYNRYARSGAATHGQPLDLRGRRIDLSIDVDVWFDDYLSRLHLDPLRVGTATEFVQLGFSCIGSAVVEVFYATQDQQVCVSRDVFAAETLTDFVTAPVCIGDLPAGGNLRLHVRTPGSGVSMSGMHWRGMTSSPREAAGAKLVLVRTYGNRDVVFSNLASINQYLTDVGDSLDDYLFVIYDATGRNEQALMPSFPQLNILELAGGNYGGGGNASFLAALALRAEALLPAGSISEVILWDDDAVIEPEFLFRHRGYVQLRHDNVAQTAMVLGKQNPGMVQEYGGIWGGYFSPLTHQVDLSIGEQRRTFPYLVRHGRLLNRDVNLLSSGQEIEFGTFIFLSLPMPLLRQLDAPLPFFLRNDDVDLCLRIKAVGGKLIANQNWLAWHDASFNFLGEFFATLHGWIVNNTHFDYPVGEFLSSMLRRLQATHNVGNFPMLYLYRRALEMYQRGPDWFLSTSVFKEYVVVMGDIREAQKTIKQVPGEVFETLDRQNGLEVHDFFDGTSGRQDSQKQVVFIDKTDSKYYVVEVEPETLDSELQLAVALVSQVAEEYEELRGRWKSALEGFRLDEFWLAFEADHAGFVREIVGAEGAQANPFGQGSSPWNTRDDMSRLPEAVSVESSQGNGAGQEDSDLPSDFDAEVYTRLNPDIKLAGVDPIEHYLTQGKHENRKYR